jgi:N-acetylglucosamine kinase-like BadF-type ATPase
MKVGIDGGGTKTECILVDATGAVVARRTAPGCNPSIAGPAEAGRVVTEALQALVPPDVRPRVSATLLCMAGNRAFWGEFAAGLPGYGRVVSTDDSPPILELATEGEPGLVLHSGTGSFVAARRRRDEAPAKSGLQRDEALAKSGARPPAGPDEGTCYAGGIGWRFGDQGSAYDIGRQAVARALLEMQGWLEPSGLGALVREATGLSEGSAITRHYYDDPAPNLEIAGLAPGVLKLAAAGDPAAAAVAVDSALQLLDLAVCVAARLFPEQPSGALRAGLSGPILTHPSVMPALRARAPFPLHPVVGRPIEGVRRMLLRL